VKLIRIVSIVALVLVLALIGAGVGCGGKGGGEAARMMSMIPEDASRFMFVDIKTLQGDEDLEGLYEDMFSDIDEMLATLGIDADDIYRIAGSGETLLLLDGVFDLDEARSALEDHGFDKSEYKDVELWEDPSGYAGVALMRNLIVVGGQDAVEDCIKAIKGGESSLRDNRDAREVMDRLPGGIVMGLGIGEAFSELFEQEYEDLKAGGMSVGKKDKDTLKVTAVLKFEDRDAAENAAGKAESDLEEEGYQNIHIDRDNEFVKVTAEIGIDDFLADNDD
jgi:hypothetical protein